MAKRNIEETWQNLVGALLVFLIIVFVVVIVGSIRGWF